MILVTGANGKLGRALVAALKEIGPVRGAARAMPTNLAAGSDAVAVGPLSGQTDWRAALSGVTTVIHCAALTWLDPGEPDQSAFRTVNVEASVALATQAAAAGVKRMVFISSLTVNGKHSDIRPFRPDDQPDPKSFYSQTKWEAEQGLHAIATETGLEVVIIRPPRIIWDELSGNLAVMAKLIARGVPLPFGTLIHNARDNVSSASLVSAIKLAATVPAAAGEVFLISDDNPLSTKALVEWLAARQGKRARLIPVPARVLKAGMAIVPSALLGKLDRREMIDELTRDLRVDVSKARAVLGWSPAPVGC